MEEEVRKITKSVTYYLNGPLQQNMVDLNYSRKEIRKEIFLLQNVSSFIEMEWKKDEYKFSIFFF